LSVASTNGVVWPAVESAKTSSFLTEVGDNVSAGSRVETKPPGSRSGFARELIAGAFSLDGWYISFATFGRATGSAEITN